MKAVQGGRIVEDVEAAEARIGSDLRDRIEQLREERERLSAPVEAARLELAAAMDPDAFKLRDKAIENEEQQNRLVQEAEAELVEAHEALALRQVDLNVARAEVRKLDGVHFSRFNDYLDTKSAVEYWSGRCDELLDEVSDALYQKHPAAVERIDVLTEEIDRLTELLREQNGGGGNAIH